MRYQKLQRDTHREPTPLVVHMEDIFVWHPLITSIVAGHSSQNATAELIRTIYYTSVHGAPNDADDVAYKLASLQCVSREGFSQSNIVPTVFTKSEGVGKRDKTRKVDISLTIDVLRHVYSRHIDIAFILSGDGDYLPVIKECMRAGVKVWVGAFSNGVDKRLQTAGDKFFLLDDLFLHAPNRR